MNHVATELFWTTYYRLPAEVRALAVPVLRKNAKHPLYFKKATR